MAAPANSGNYIGFDVGNARIGVAIASAVARLSHPHQTIANDAQVWEVVTRLVTDERAAKLVVGLPRNLSGDDTPQTAVARAFATQLKTVTKLPVYLQDEALTSRRAEDELASRGKPYAKGDIDALAATYILEDYLVNERNADEL